MRKLSSAALCLALVACGGKGDGDATKASPGSGAPAAGSSAPPAAALEVFVNDVSVAKVTAAQVAAWPRLDSLVPPANRRLGQWGTVALVDATKTTPITKPSDTYPDRIPAIYPVAGGGVAFGMFDAVELANHGAPAMHQDGLREIRIQIANNGRGQNEDGSETAGDPSKLVIAIKTPAGESTVTGDKLLALPREPAPGGQSEAKGWRLAQILELAGIKTFEKLLLADNGGANLPLEKADFDPKVAIPFVKLNRKGLLRLTVYKKKGDGWAAAADLRAMSSIQVLK